MRAYDPRIYPWARCRRDRQKMAGKPIYTIDAIAERRAVRALIRKLAGLAGEASRCPLYPRKRTNSGPLGMSALCQKRTHALQQKQHLYPITSSARCWSSASTSLANHVKSSPCALVRLVDQPHGARAVVHAD